MQVESRMNKKPFVCNESIKITNGKNNNYSWLTHSLDRGDVFFIHRYSSFLCITVHIIGKAFTSDYPLNYHEEKYIKKHLIKKQ